MVLLKGDSPVLFDTGYASDYSETVQLLRDAGTPPESLSLIVNSHYHPDHAGGNHQLQHDYGIPIAAHRWEGDMVNRRDPEACSAVWMRMPIDLYTVNRLLSDGDEIECGTVTLQVIHTQGHTLGHISLFEPESKTLLAGDAVHSDDVAWIGIFREGVGALRRALESLDRLAALAPKAMVSGHSALYEYPLKAIDTARRRYESWLAEPQRMGWHACKRILVYTLMLEDGMSREEVQAYLLTSPWFLDYSRYVFQTEPTDFVKPLVDELVRSGAAEWQNGKLMPSAPYSPPAKHQFKRSASRPK